MTTYVDLPRATPQRSDDGAFLASLIADELVADRTDRPTAGGTPLRGTHAGKCLRAVQYDTLGVAATEPPGPSSLWTFLMGNAAHEAAQRALERRFPAAHLEAEVVSDDALFSCHIDALVPMTTHDACAAWPDALAGGDWQGQATRPVTVAWEIKSTQKFAYEQIVGTARKAGEGPRLGDFLQGALNATAAKADLLVLSYLTLGVTQSGDVSAAEQIGRDYVYTPDQFEPPAQAELERLSVVLGEGLAPRSAPIMPAGAVITDPTRSFWTVESSGPGPAAILDSGQVWGGKYCTQYCSFYSRCVADGA